MPNLMQVGWWKWSWQMHGGVLPPTTPPPSGKHTHHLVTVCMASPSSIFFLFFYFFSLSTFSSFMFPTWHSPVLFSSFRLPSFRFQRLLWWFVSRARSAGAEPSQRGNWWQSLVTWRPQNVGELRPLWALSFPLLSPPQPDGLPRQTSAEVVGAALAHWGDGAVDLLLW